MTDHPQGTRGIAYVRVSTDRQDTERQHQSLKLWAERHRVTPTTLQDVGRRHQAASRGDFQKLIKLVTGRQIDWIVLDAIDRLGFADPLEWGYYAHLCRSNGVEIWSASEDKCLTRLDTATVLTSNISAISSRDEMTKKALRDLGKKRQMATGAAGEFPGGWVPFGCDAVVIGSDGAERWRVVTVGKWQRLKTWPDGRTERYDGQGNFPPRAQGERLVLRPTVVAERLRALAFACERVAAGHSMNSTAKALNDLGLFHPHGRWYAVLLKECLKNPALVGKPAYNKSSSARYGQLVGRVPTALGEARPKHTRRPREEWEGPAEAVYAPLVDPELHQRMLDRLADRTPGRRAPKSLRLWMSGLIVCHRCQTRMVGWAMPADKKTPFSYCCATYRRHGASNATGCRLHRVAQPRLEGILDDYLSGLDETIGEVKAAGEDGLFGLVFDQQKATHARLASLREGMEHFLLRTLEQVAEPQPLPDGRTRFVVDAGDGPVTLDLPGCASPGALQSVYGWVRSATAGRARERVAAIDGRLKALVATWSELPGQRAKELCSEEIARLEGERAAMEEGATDLGSEVRELFATLGGLHAKVRAARAGADLERKSRLVRGIVERVELEFSYSTHGQQVRSHLVRATVVPLIDAPSKTYAVEGARGRG